MKKKMNLIFSCPSVVRRFDLLNLMQKSCGIIKIKTIYFFAKSLPLKLGLGRD
tara:strand:+ start:245 stop:403 length:159 start_codon:yes stop_codon:yes gene_type:complete